MRAGGTKGGVLKEWYSRAVDQGVKRDIGFWFIDRPGVTAEEMEGWKEEVKRQMARKRELEEKEKRERVQTGKVDMEKESGGGEA